VVLGSREGAAKVVATGGGGSRGRGGEGDRREAEAGGE